MAPEEAYPRAKAAATRALQREADLAEAITSIGKVLCWHEWDFAGAARQLERAVAQAPNYAEAHFVLGTALPAVGRLGDAVDELKKAMSLDPLSPDHSGWLSRFMLYARDFAGAIAQARKTIELDENYVRAYLYIGSAYLGQGDPEQALEWFRRGQSLPKSVRSYDALIVLALARLGRSDEAEEILSRLEDESKRQYIRSEILAMGYGAVGELDKAFASLERAFEARSAGLIYLHVDPGYEPLRADPRFVNLVARIGLH